MKTIKYLIFSLIISNITIATAQDRAFEFKNNFNCKFTFYGFIGGGIGTGISVGIWKGFSRTQAPWKEFKIPQKVEVVQTALNISSIFAFGKNHLGNNGREGTRWQWNLVLSPVITTSFHWKDATKKGIYEELNPLYLNNSSSIYSNYRSSFTFGTSFVTVPKGFGRNYITSRNRSQQLAFFNTKWGYGDRKSIQFNLIEDVGPQFLADKWDRFFTGGGSVQVRYDYFKAKVFSEVYTGTTQRDMVDFPDITIPNDSVGTNGKGKWRRGGIRRELIYALQEASQKTYNNGRTVYSLEVDEAFFRPNKAPFINRFSYNFYFFTQGGPDMWSQNAIHSWSNGDIQKVIDNNLTDNKKPFKVKGDKVNFLMPKHYFEPFYTNRTRGIGVGMNYIFSY